MFNRVGVLGHFFETFSPEIQTLAVDVNLMKDAGFFNTGMGKSTAHVKVPEPSSFDGVRNAKTLENFLWDMEQYFKVARVFEGK